MEEKTKEQKEVNKTEETNEKEVSNKKAIIAIITIAVLLIVVGAVYATIFNNKDNTDKNNLTNNIQKTNETPSNVDPIITNTSTNTNKITPNPYSDDPMVDFKPIIYLYPTEETKVSVEVGKPENLTHTYPKYEDSWEVLAKSNGELVDLKTGRNLYALYWEGINEVKPNMNEGFVVKGEDTIEFLEEKLSILGLNEREAEEFIVYWLPKLEGNKYNFIRFQEIEEINENMPLEIKPTPDTIVRVMMEFKGLDEPIKVQEQKLETPVREGFTVVEWGGTEIK